MFKRISTRSLLLALAIGLWFSGCTTAGENAPSEATAKAHLELPRWTAGVTHRYQTRLHSQVGFVPAAKEGFDFGLSAVAEITPVRSQGDEVELLMQLTDVKLSSKNARNESDQEALAARLREPYLFTLKAGRLHASRMTASVDAEAGSVLRSLSAAFQVSAGDSPAVDRWKVSENDSTGAYMTEYSRDGSVLRKKKLEYTQLNVAGEINESVRRGMLPRVLESQSELAIADGSLKHVTLREHIESTLALDQKIAVRTDLSLRELGSAPAKALDVAALRGGMREVRADAPIATSLRKDRFDDVKIGDVSFEDILSLLETEQEKLAKLDAEAARVATQGEAAKRNHEEARNQNTRARLQSFSAMAALLRQDDAALPKAVALVRAGSPVEESLLDAIGSSGTPAAQRALIELLQDASIGKHLRGSAAMSLIRVKEPQPANVVALRDLIRDPLLKEYAIYGLGTASRRLRQNGLAAPAQDASDAIIALLAAAQDDETRMLALRGISNSADRRAMPAIKPWLTHKAQGVREAALDALRMMDDPDADAWIAERLLNDENTSVQAAALAAAGQRQPTQRMADALASVSLKGKAAIVRHRAVELSTRWLESQPALGPMLEQVAKEESEAPIREMAQHALTMAKQKR